MNDFIQEKDIQIKKGKTAIAATKIQTLIKTNILNQQQTSPNILPSGFFILTLPIIFLLLYKYIDNQHIRISTEQRK
jgi:hypothetical protein